MNGQQKRGNAGEAEERDVVNPGPVTFWCDESAEIDKACWDLRVFGTGVVWIGSDGTTRHIPLKEISVGCELQSVGAPAVGEVTVTETFTPAAEPGLVLGTVTRPGGGTQNVVSAKAAVNDKSVFGVIDALDPNARLNVLIQTAQTHRTQNPDAPVRAAELAVNEVLRLRKDNAEIKRNVRQLGRLINWVLEL